MAIKLASNISVLKAQRRFNEAVGALSEVNQRLASGQRINRASADAAGLAVSSSLKADRLISSQGIRNINDGISALSIADAAIESLGSIASRVTELATQSMNATITDTQRASLQAEVTALQNEWNRIIETTTFNGKNLLTGADTAFSLQGTRGTQGTLQVQVGEAQLTAGVSGYAGGTSRVSTSSGGDEGFGDSDTVVISPDGRYVAFSSTSSELTAGDTNSVPDAFVKDTLTGTTTRISTSSSGVEGNDGSSIADISLDGRYVAFISSASNLVTGDTNGVSDAFIKDTVTGITTRVSTSSDGVQANGASTFMKISADGRYVTFTSAASNLVANDTNGVSDVFIKDTLTGTTTRVSTSSEGAQANASSNLAAVSADGRYVAFFSNASNLVAGDTNGATDAFIKDTLTGTTTRVSTSSAGSEGNGSSIVTAISADGRYVAFYSLASNLVAGDTNGTADSFIKDTVTGTTTRVSTSSQGAQVNGSSYVTGISADGRYVVFESDASNVVSGDVNGYNDVFIKDLSTGLTTMISTASAGTQGDSGSISSVISADGRYVAFVTDSSNLVSGDTNGTIDVFFKDLTKVGLQTMSGFVVSNKASAAVTLALSQRYQDDLTEYRGQIGALTSRANSFQRTLEAATLNFRSAESRITDADMASEAAHAVSLSINQDVAAAVLAQANGAPQIALNLLESALAL